jgi:sigma-B regulation protein RsbU (phosphoserine phosphatase)
MWRVRPVARRLGKSGIAFLIAFTCYLVFYFSGRGALAILTLLALVPLGAILTVRGFRYIQRNSLWSVRNRLLLAYGLMGVLPILLLFILIGLSVWGITNDLAIYLASSALERRLDGINGTVDALQRMEPDHRAPAAAEMQLAFNRVFPGIAFYVRDRTGFHRYPPNGPEVIIPAGWKNTSGLLVWRDHFYGWSHRINDQAETTALAPLSDEFVENLVPNLGIIELLEQDREGSGRTSQAVAGALRATNTGDAKNPDFHFGINELSTITPGRRRGLPPAIFTLDVPVFLPATIPHVHIDSPNRSFDGVLWVYSRPSAVLSTFFAKSEFMSGFLSVLFVSVVILFIIVEFVAVVIGVSLSRRITGAVHQLYEGTRRVIQGDFRQRIPVRDHDQLGELSQSFNQMTGNLERLLEVETEKERLQTELEIAREVQSVLYPKAAPPLRGLKLTVRCDPARMVSGDYYDYQEIARGKLAFAIGDVSGKGISAALLMATLQAALRAQISQHLPTHESECSHLPDIEVGQFVSRLNKQIFAHTAPEKYATFFFAIFEEMTRTLTYTNAGHLSPLLFRDGSVLPLDSNGTVVGAFPFSKYDESCLTLCPGDLLVCYTDGITEPENAYGEMFGEERLIDLVQKHAHEDDGEIIRIVLEAVRGWTGVPELHDDMTLLFAREMQSA